MATPAKPSLEERMQARRRGNPDAVRMFADLALGVVLVLVTVLMWSPTTAPRAVAYGLKAFVPLAAILLFLRAFQRST